jgi:hypothetical protein
MKHTSQAASTEVACPVCAFRVSVSPAGVKRISPAPVCLQSQGWEKCPHLKPKLSEARQAALEL